jgi:hypothetical protein
MMIIDASCFALIAKCSRKARPNATFNNAGDRMKGGRHGRFCPRAAGSPRAARLTARNT